MLNVKNLSVSISGQPILSDVSFRVSPQEILMVVGPNGSGKTTLVRALLRQLPKQGEVFWLDRPIETYGSAELAKGIGVLTQNNAFAFSYKVEEVIALGRYAHQQGLFTGLNEKDRAFIEQAMEATQVSHLRGRDVTSLSGGELQRVCLARVFAQDPRLLILDEPTNHLDIEHQLLIFDLIRTWAQQPGRSVLAIVHDLNLAYAYGSRAMLLNQGRRVAIGSLAEVLSRENLQAAYHIDLVDWMQSLSRYWE